MEEIDRQNKSNIIKNIIVKIKNLCNNEKIHILNILQKSSIEFSKNNNGYFFNLDAIDITLLQKVLQCINLIEKNRDTLLKLDKQRNMHLTYYQNLIESKLNQTFLIKRQTYLNKLITTLNEFKYSKFINKKVKIINWINQKPEYVDPDILMKEYEIQCKYKKDTVYYRLYQKTRIVSKKYINKIKHNNDDARYDDTGEGDDNEYGNDGNEADIEDDVHIDADFDETNNDIDEDADADADTDTDDGTEENISEEYLDEDAKIILNTQIAFYKQLLAQNGYIFDYNKNINLKIEEYIH
jgi:hypothetical protein